MKSLEIGGLLIQYLNICKRKLWFYIKGLRMESRSDLVALGRIIDQQYYVRYKDEDEYSQDFIRTDFLTNTEGVVVHEVKKTDTLVEEQSWQVKYYLYVLKRRGVDIKYGILHYPEKRRKINVYLTEQDEKIIQEMLEEIQNISKMEIPPPIESKSYCGQCAYFELCWAGEVRKNVKRKKNNNSLRR
ncbi:MAG: CRISPR-associated protein Cas4 [Candidatus Anstonellales archaeon]